MALEQRQTQIQEGAGLTEGRLNQDFILFLKKWTLPIVLVVLAVAAGIVGLKRLAQYREDRLVAAFAEFQAAVASGNPVSLVRVAEDHEGKAAIPLLARLAAADQYLVAAYRGVAPGATLDNDGKPSDAKDLLNAEQRDRMIAQAAELYQRVVSDAGTARGMALQAIGARFGLAAIAETRGQPEEAKKQYQAVIDAAKAAGYAGLADEARKRLETVGSLTATTLYAKSDVRTGSPSSRVPTEIPPEILRQLESQGTATMPMPGSTPRTRPPMLPPDIEPVFPGDPAPAPTPVPPFAVPGEKSPPPTKQP